MMQQIVTYHLVTKVYAFHVQLIVCKKAWNLYLISVSICSPCHIYYMLRIMEVGKNTNRLRVLPHTKRKLVVLCNFGFMPVQMNSGWQ